MSQLLSPIHLLKQLCSRNPPAVAEAEAPVLDTSTLSSRYKAYGVLYCAGIPSCIWFEDALENLGVPISTFCLFLMVPSAQVAQAADQLKWSGYRKRRPVLAFRRIPQFKNIYGLVDMPGTSQSGKGNEADEDDDDDEKLPPLDIDEIVDPDHPPVILLPAETWFYHDIPKTTAVMKDCFPTLPRMLTSLVEKWLSLTQDHDYDELRLFLAIQIEYLYDYLEEVKKPGFEQNLPRHLWKFHFDGVNGTEPRELDSFATQRMYLEEEGLDIGSKLVR